VQSDPNAGSVGKVLEKTHKRIMRVVAGGSSRKEGEEEICFSMSGEQALRVLQGGSTSDFIEPSKSEETAILVKASKNDTGVMG